MTNFNKAFRFINLVQQHKRIRVDRLADIMKCDKRSIYRLIQSALSSTPIYLEDGVVVWGGKTYEEIEERHNRFKV